MKKLLLLLGLSTISMVPAKAMDAKTFCLTMENLGIEVVSAKKSGVTYSQAKSIVEPMKAGLGPQGAILSEIVRIGYSTTLDAKTYGFVVFSECMKQFNK